MIDYGYGVQLDVLQSEAMDNPIRRWRNEYKVRRVCRQVGLVEEKQQVKWFESQSFDPSVNMFLVLIKAKDAAPSRVVGVAGLTNMHSVHRNAELSLYIAPSEQDGVPPNTGKAIIKTLCSYAFEEMNLNRVFGESFAFNTVAVLNLKDCGFKNEGVLRQTYYKDGKYTDSIIQSLLRTEYDTIKKDWGFNGHVS